MPKWHVTGRTALAPRLCTGKAIELAHGPDPQRVPVAAASASCTYATVAASQQSRLSVRLRVDVTVGAGLACCSGALSSARLVGASLIR